VTAALFTPRPEALARLSAKCRLCHRRIVAGDHYVARLPRLGWVHSDCASGYCRLREENAELDS
jgi:hypothetical protein